MNKSEVSGVVFLDLKKAFSLVDHDILLKKLSIYLKNSSSLPFCKLYLHNRTQYVLLHGSYSSKESVKYGVPQGSVSGPILFSLFINDLPLHMKTISVDCDMLADDTTVHTSGKIYYANQKQYARQLRSGIQLVIIITQGKHAECRQSEPAQCCDMDGKRIGEADQVMGIQLNSCRFTVVLMTGTKGLTLEGSSQGCCGQE